MNKKERWQDRFSNAYDGFNLCDQIKIGDKKRLLDFIQSELSQQRTELLEEILSEIDKLSMPVGRNELEELIISLQKEK